MLCETAAGVHTPQIKLVSSTLEQLTAEGHNLWKQFKDMSHPSGAAVLAAARDAAAASAVHAAIGGASEIGSAAAAASKAATAVVQTAGVVSPESVVYSPEKSAHEQQERQSSLVDQLPALSAKTAGRASAEQASISLLCTLPYCEVLFFVDTLNMRSRSHSTVRHRWVEDFNVQKPPRCRWRVHVVHHVVTPTAVCIPTTIAGYGKMVEKTAWSVQYMLQLSSVVPAALLFARSCTCIAWLTTRCC